MDFLIKALQLILSLSILVILHEFGHFLFARLFKTRVEKFYLFFDAGFSLFKFKKGETEYGVGWLPLGGYVKISGMIDESMDKEQMKQPPQPHEFRAKPAWQRLLIMVGGVLVNFILAIVIFWMILFSWGESYVPVEGATYGYAYHPIGLEIGLQDGDRILYVDTLKVNTISDVHHHVLLEDPSTFTVQRGDSVFELALPDELGQRFLSEEVKKFAQYRIPFVVDSVVAGMPAEEAGILKGDSLVGVADKEAPFFDEFVNELFHHKGNSTTVSFYRNGELLTLPINVNKSGKIGIAPRSPAAYLDVETKKYGFFEAFPAGIKKGTDLLVSYVKQLRLIFTKEGARQVGGFGTIGSLFPASWDWYSFWTTTAFLSIILAFMNILPIPALDGGHVMFLLYEIVARRKPNEKFMEHAQLVGMILLVALLLYANGNDLFRWLFE
ncbi:RIP metalloprotease RseP [Marinilabilia sp.]|uniref:RIP metalloprotease RseP n=1 Tax=Marinilabilia sp. TaxID=2021252 RepID=UPI0025C21271|nr:RIP metalloprotease RseP [Marinilabilia sp.]